MVTKMNLLDRFMPYVVFALAFSVYLLTAAPLITAGDSGELVTAAFVLGVPHPPGYPLYCLLGKLSSLTPVGNVAYRLNLMSGAFSAANAVLIYKVAAKLSEVKSAGASAGAAAIAIAAAFTGVFWGQATGAEVYPLQLSLSLGTIYALLKAREKADSRYVYLASLLFGLSVVAHYSALLLAPGFAFFIFYSTPGATKKNWAAPALLFLLMGLSVFVYLAPRAYASPPINWGDPENLENFAVHISRAAYGDLAAFNVSTLMKGLAGKSMSGTGMLIIMVSALMILAVAFRGLFKERVFRLLPFALAVLTVLYMADLARRGVTLEKLAYLGSLLRSEAWTGLMVAALVGLVVWLVKDRAVFYMFALDFLSVLVVSLYRVPVDPRIYLLPLIDKFFLPFFALAGIAAAYVTAAGLGWVSSKGKVWRMGSASMGVMVMAIPVFFLVRNHDTHDCSRNYYAYDYSSCILRGLEQDAVYLAEGDNQPFLMMYQKYVEGKRPDVEVFEVTGNIWRPYEEARMLNVEGMRPIYCTVEKDIDGFPGVKLERAGLISRFPYSYIRIKDPWVYYNFRLGGAEMIYEDHQDREIIANYYYYSGMRLLDKGLRNDADAEFGRALWIGYDFVWINYDIGNIRRDVYGEPGKAKKLYEKALRLTPGFAAGYLEMGNADMSLGDEDSAIKAYKQAIKWDPLLYQAYYNLAMISTNRGHTKEAIEYLASCLKNCPDEDKPVVTENINRLTRKP